MTEYATLTSEGALRDTPLADVEVDALASGKRTLAAALATAELPLREGTFLPVESFIPEKRELGRAAGHRIVYASESNAEAFRTVRQAFDWLGDEIDRRL